MRGALDDTICAIATAASPGGIGIVRISGNLAVATAEGLVRLRAGTPLSKMATHTLYLADLCETNASGPAGPDAFIDEALVTVMRGPHSYTGEDLVELHCHGGLLILERVCAALMRRGARAAEPGEFTKRAFLNGRLDLAQAEAVLDTITARTTGSLRVAQDQLRGTLSRAIERLRDPLIRLLAHVEAGIDFVGEDVALVDPTHLLQGLHRAGEDIARLLASFETGQLLREGVTTAILGRPNVGKSSLMNALLQSDRAIVTPVPGTTRDVLEESFAIQGLLIRLLDTAGVRQTDDVVEREGVRRTRLARDRADLLVLVLDGSVPLTQEDRELVAELGQASHQKRVVVVNKNDLPSRVPDGEIARALEAGCPSPHGALDAGPIRISARTGAGLDLLRDRIHALCVTRSLEADEAVFLTRARHREALERAQDALREATTTVNGAMPAEYVVVDLRGAINALGEIIGEVTTDDLLDRIFRDFCIGK